jgi:hypothetical protein
LTTVWRAYAIGFRGGYRRAQVELRREIEDTLELIRKANSRTRSWLDSVEVRVVSYLGYSGHGAKAFGRAARDPFRKLNS